MDQARRVFEMQRLVSFATGSASPPKFSTYCLFEGSSRLMRNSSMRKDRRSLTKAIETNSVGSKMWSVVENTAVRFGYRRHDY